MLEQFSWNGLMKVLEVQHRDDKENLLWQQKNIFNTLHTSGEQFILLSLFTGGSQSNSYIPNSYFLGLDNRASLSVADTMSTINGEPIGMGYIRQSVSSTTGFTVVETSLGYQANTAAVTFRAISGSWGPVQNVFLTTTNDYSGYLIASAQLGSPFTVTMGQTITLTLGFSLRDCPIVSN